MIHHNLANLVYPDDENLLADLQHAVEDLEVNHIVLCGHYGCAGIAAALRDDLNGHMWTWLRGVRSVYEQNEAELSAIEDPVDRQNRLAEHNVREQLVRLNDADIIRRAVERGQPLLLHGWIYDLRIGRLAQLLEIDPTEETVNQDMPPRIISASPVEQPDLKVIA